MFFLFGFFIYVFFRASINTASPIYLTLSLILLLYVLVIIPQRKYFLENKDNGGTE